MRCGIEARLHEYAARGPGTKTQEKTWQIKKISRQIERLFEGDEKIEMKVHDPKTKSKFSIYFTPVTKSLQKKGERLGKYLHCLNETDISDLKSFNQFRHLLEATCKELADATSGIVIGPLLQNANGGISFQFEKGVDPRFDRIAKNVGDQIEISITFLLLKKDAKGATLKQV